MLTGALNFSYANIAVFYKKNENNLASNLAHIGTGKKVNNPSESIPDYFYAKKINRESKDYSHISQEISEASALMEVASNAGENVFNSLNRMRDLVNIYYDSNTTAEEQDGIKAEFDALKTQAQFTVDNAKYDGENLIQDTGAGTLESINIDPYDINVKFDISFSGDQVANASSLTLGSGVEADDANAVQAELDKAGSYLAKVSAYSQGLRSQNNLITKKINVNNAVQGRLTDTDTASEMAKAVDREVRNQSSLAMMAQANVMRSSVLRLFEMY